MEKFKHEREFVEMIEAHKGIIYKLCFMYAPCPENARDYYQEAVCRLWEAFPRFRGESKLSTWVYRVTLFTCVSYLRKAKRSPAVVPLAVDPGFMDDTDAGADRLGELYAMIARLGNTEKALLMLWLEEKSYDEIAEITGLTKSNVAVKLMRIKDKLKKMSNSKCE